MRYIVCTLIVLILSSSICIAEPLATQKCGVNWFALHKKNNLDPSEYIIVTKNSKIDIKIINEIIIFTENYTVFTIKFDGKNYIAENLTEKNKKNINSDSCFAGIYNMVMKQYRGF